jgi:predicted amidohydrolase
MEDDKRLHELIELSRGVSILIGLVEHSREHFFFNSAFYLEGGQLLHRHRKAYLPTYGMFDEGRYFSPGNRVQATRSRFGRLGIMICEDAWHPINPYILCQDGAQVLLVISNSPVRGMAPDGQFQSVRNWARITQTYALLYSSFLVYVNRVGCEDGISFSGCSQAIDPNGEPIATLPFLEESEGTLELDPGDLPRARIHSPILRDENFLLSFNELERIKKTTYGN